MRAPATGTTFTQKQARTHGMKSLRTAAARQVLQKARGAHDPRLRQQHRAAVAVLGAFLRLLLGVDESEREPRAPRSQQVVQTAGELADQVVGGPARGWRLIVVCQRVRSRGRHQPADGASVTGRMVQQPKHRGGTRLTPMQRPATSTAVDMRFDMGSSRTFVHAHSDCRCRRVASMRSADPGHPHSARSTQHSPGEVRGGLGASTTTAASKKRK